MGFVRTFLMIAFAALAAGCSGNLGGGQSTLPGAPQSGSNTQSVAQAAPTPSPVSASNVATLGDSAGAQPIPPYDGWGGTIAFAKPQASASPTPNAKGTPAAAVDPGANPVSIGITSSVVEPSDAPRFNPAAGKHHSKRDPSVPSGLFFITLLATADVTLGEYPRIVIDVPRDVAAKYHDQSFRLALYDPETKAKSYRLDVAQRDLAAPDTGSLPTPVPTPIPTPVPSPTPFPFGMPPGGLSPPPTPLAGADFERNALPPQEIAFLPTAAKLTLHENQPVFFALYVVAPTPSPSPAASPKATATASPAPKASAGGTPAAASSPSAAPAPSATRTAAPTSVR